ncbi:hypothetical protein HHI36_011671 [Cryptolaemus montrouzieri]|uniref:Uncharacterized protein n=1 Tax=Cryptolaemus montrouzieri TaxID=559131 RepID=A0ABD2MN83_9CUCU
MEPWFTQGIRISARRKNFLYHLKNEESCQSSKITVKEKYEATWTLIRQHTQANMKRNTSVLEGIDKQLSPEEILNTVNEFFSSQGTASKMINEASKQTSEPMCNSIVFFPTDAMEIE